MNKLQQTILERSQILPGSVLKVDNFLNHCIDTDLMEEIGQLFADHFAQAGITKILTVESGGIAPAYATATRLGVPLVFAKKTEPCTMLHPLTARVFSYTKKKNYIICVEDHTLQDNDRVLFIDDFLANGEAFKGVESLIRQANAQLVGIGICIEKLWQKGHDDIVSKGYDLCSLCSLEAIDDQGIHIHQSEQK